MAINKLKGRKYTEHKMKVWEEQGKRCYGCGWFLPFKYAEFDHFAGRGMMGSKRDDLDPRNRIYCHDCHVLQGKRDTDCNAERRRQNSPKGVNRIS